MGKVTQELAPCPECGTVSGPARYEEPEQFLIGCQCWSGWYPTIEAAREAWVARYVLRAGAVGDHSAVFTIRLEPDKTSCHTSAGDLTEPVECIERAISVLLHEKTKIERCPRHQALATRKESVR